MSNSLECAEVWISPPGRLHQSIVSPDAMRCYAMLCYAMLCSTSTSTPSLARVAPPTCMRGTDTKQSRQQIKRVSSPADGCWGKKGEYVRNSNRITRALCAIFIVYYRLVSTHARRKKKVAGFISLPHSPSPCSSLIEYGTGSRCTVLCCSPAHCIHFFSAEDLCSLVCCVLEATGFFFPSPLLRPCYAEWCAVTYAHTLGGHGGMYSCLYILRRT